MSYSQAELIEIGQRRLAQDQRIHSYLIGNPGRFFYVGKGAGPEVLKVQLCVKPVPIPVETLKKLSKTGEGELVSCIASCDVDRKTGATSEPELFELPPGGP